MRSKPETILEDPTKTQKEVLNPFGYEISPYGGLAVVKFIMASLLIC